MKRPIVRRDRHEACEDCGHPNGGTRMIVFPSGFRYRVCADHEHEYVRGYGATVIRPHWRGPDRECWCGYAHPLVEWNRVTREWYLVAPGFWPFR